MDRFGDDICELILSYLTLEVKYNQKLELVSKQWQRLLYVKDIHVRIGNSRGLYTVEIPDYKSRQSQIRITCEQLLALLSKFTSVTTISLCGYDHMVHEIFQCLRRPTLKVLKLHYNEQCGIYYEDLFYLIYHCGRQLYNLEIHGLPTEQFKEILNLTPNLKTLYSDNIICARTLQHLEKLEAISIDGPYEYEIFETLVQRYGHQLKRLYLLFPQPTYNIGPFIIQLKELRELQEIRVNESLSPELIILLFYKSKIKCLHCIEWKVKLIMIQDFPKHKRKILKSQKSNEVIQYYGVWEPKAVTLDDLIKKFKR